MGDIVKAWTDGGWCDACKTNLDLYPHEEGCPIAEIERLRDALMKLADDDTYLVNAAEWHDVGHMRSGVQAIARVALGKQ